MLEQSMTIELSPEFLARIEDLESNITSLKFDIKNIFCQLQYLKAALYPHGYPTEDK